MKPPTSLPHAVTRWVVQPWRRRIQLLWALKWLAFPLLPLFEAFAFRLSFWTLLFALVCLLLHGAVNAWEASQRRQFIREARFPALLGAKLLALYPQLRPSDVELVLHGLRQFFMAHLRSRRRFVAMPSKVVDAAWHEFILHTRAYEVWCNAAFGKLMHHTPAEVLGRDPKRNDGLRRTWYWACKEESINPRNPSACPCCLRWTRSLRLRGASAMCPIAATSTARRVRTPTAAPASATGATAAGRRVTPTALVGANRRAATAAAAGTQGAAVEGVAGAISPLSRCCDSMECRAPLH
jgi:hypothetical protein